VESLSIISGADLTIFPSTSPDEARQNILRQAAASEMPSRTFVVQRGIERSDNGVGGHFAEPSRMLKNYCGPEESGTGGSHGTFQPNPQAVQKVCSARPQRVKVQGLALLTRPPQAAKTACFPSGVR
jgi:hypothetical protein